MSVGFGFSITDFVNAIKLVEVVTDALSADSRSSGELRELFRQLHNLETALREVKRIEVSESLHAEVLALKQSAAQCQITITDFLKKTRSYQPHLLSSHGSSKTLQSTWRRVKWALCDKKDVVQFKADLVGHTGSINLLLATVHMKNVSVDHGNQRVSMRSISSSIQTGFSNCMSRLTVMHSTLTKASTLTQDCLNATRRIISMNVRVFQVVLDIQNNLKTMPRQIERQQPVYLNDACGRYTPFHLEFVRCPEALISVLAFNLGRNRCASKRVQDGNFTIHDPRNKMDIDLNGPWDDCFTPGQHVEMSMVFDRPETGNASCPGCRTTCTTDEDEDNECDKCGLIFRRIVTAEDWETLPETGATATYEDRTEALKGQVHRQESNVTRLKRKFADGYDEEDLTKYRRVRLRCQPMKTSDNLRQSKPKQFVSGDSIWDRVKNSEKATSGEVDMDDLCSQLNTKAEWSDKGGLVIDQADVDQLLGPPATEEQKERFHKVGYPTNPALHENSSHPSYTDLPQYRHLDWQRPPPGSPIMSPTSKLNSTPDDVHRPKYFLIDALTRQRC